MLTCRYFDKCTNMYFCVPDVSYFIYSHIIYIHFTTLYIILKCVHLM